MPVRTRLSRRAALTLAATLPLALAACDIDPPASGGPGASPVPADPDAGLLTQVVAAIDGIAGRLAATTASDAGLAAAVSGFAALHAAHLAVLAPQREAPVTGSGAPYGRVAGLLRGQEALQHELAQASASAASGALARVLASASAGVAMQVAQTRAAGAA